MHLKQVLANNTPASALFMQEEQKLPVSPCGAPALLKTLSLTSVPCPDEWDVLSNPGLAVCGMVCTADNLYKENMC